MTKKLIIYYNHDNNPDAPSTYTIEKVYVKNNGYVLKLTFSDVTDYSRFFYFSEQGHGFIPKGIITKIEVVTSSTL